MPLPFAWLVAFALGAAFARAAQGEITKTEGPLVTSRPMLVVLGFAGLVLFPIVGYFAAFHGDWAYLYAVSWQDVPSAVDLVAALAAAALVPAGFLAAVPAIRAKRTPVVSAMVGAPLAVCAVLALVFARRLVVSATHAQYVGGFGIDSIGASPLGRGVLLGALVLVAGAAWAVRELRSS